MLLKHVVAITPSRSPISQRPQGKNVIGARNARLIVRAEKTVSASTSISKLVEQKEKELKDLTAPSPGKLPARAAVVAALRNEIAALRKQMDSGITTALPSTLVADLPIAKKSISAKSVATSSAVSTGSAAAAVGTPTSTSSSASSSARGALLLVEQQLAVASGDASSALQAVEQGMSFALGSSDELVELEALKEENARLKGELEALTARQKLLESLKKKHLGTGAAEEAPKKRTTVRRTKKADSDNDSSSGEEKPKRGRKKKETTDSPATTPETAATLA